MRLTIDWDKVWEKFEKTVYESPPHRYQEWKGYKGQQCLLREILRKDYALNFDSTTWRRFSKNFIEAYENLPPLASDEYKWSFSKEFISKYVNKLVEPLSNN